MRLSMSGTGEMSPWTLAWNLFTWPIRQRRTADASQGGCPTGVRSSAHASHSFFGEGSLWHRFGWRRYAGDAGERGRYHRVSRQLSLAGYPRYGSGLLSFAVVLAREPAMDATSGISDHYTSGTLLERLEAHLKDDGVDPARPTLEDLAPYDHFHGRGLEATKDMADHLPVAGSDRILDIGSGIGGPARYMARRFDCRVAGVDLTAEFCEVAWLLTVRLGLEHRVTFEQGDALAMPFADGTFEGAYSMNVSMNIAEKRAFYREAHRVLKPGAWLYLSEVAQGPGGEPDYPTPWARTASSSFLATAAETRANLEASGFAIESLRDTTEASLAWAARSRAVVEAGGKPLHRAVSLVHGALAEEVMANSGYASRERRTVPIELVCRRVR